MSKVLVDNSNLIGIGSAIRSKNGSNTYYKPSEMAAAINAIDVGITPTGTVNILQNGTTDVTQYASAVVNVPNSYSASDEGKVVSNGVLAAQTARASDITQNGTYDTTENNSVTVNVQSGGGSTSTFVRIWTHTTGGNDASIYVQQYTWDGESLVSLGSPVDVSFWPFYNHEYEYLDFFNSIRIKYGASITSSWELYSLKDNVFFVRDMRTISNGNLITYWAYTYTYNLLFAI